MRFELLYQAVNNTWQVFGISIVPDAVLQPGAVPPPAPAPPAAAPEPAPPALAPIPPPRP